MNTAWARVPAYTDDQGRWRDRKGRYASWVPDETCPNGCARYGDWWVPEDCPTHLCDGEAGDRG